MLNVVDDVVAVDSFFDLPESLSRPHRRSARRTVITLNTVVRVVIRLLLCQDDGLGLNTSVFDDSTVGEAE